MGGGRPSALVVLRAAFVSRFPPVVVDVVGGRRRLRYGQGGVRDERPRGGPRHPRRRPRDGRADGHGRRRGEARLEPPRTSPSPRPRRRRDREKASDVERNEKGLADDQRRGEPPPRGPYRLGGEEGPPGVREVHGRDGRRPRGTEEAGGEGYRYDEGRLRDGEGGREA